MSIGLFSFFDSSRLSVDHTNFCLCRMNVSLSVFFVNISLSLSVDFTNTILILPSSCYSLTKFVRIWMCFVLSDVFWLWANQIAPPLSTWMVVGILTFLFMVPSSWIANLISFTYESSTYSSSEVGNTTLFIPSVFNQILLHLVGFLLVL